MKFLSCSFLFICVAIIIQCCCGSEFTKVIVEACSDSIACTGKSCTNVTIPLSTCDPKLQIRVECYHSQQLCLSATTYNHFDCKNWAHQRETVFDEAACQSMINTSTGENSYGRFEYNATSKTRRYVYKCDYECIYCKGTIDVPLHTCITTEAFGGESVMFTGVQPCGNVALVKAFDAINPTSNCTADYSGVVSVAPSGQCLMDYAPQDPIVTSKRYMCA